MGVAISGYLFHFHIDYRMVNTCLAVPNNSFRADACERRRISVVHCARGTIQSLGGR